MSLASGTRLGPYEILELIGAGGMGEVYRAKDTRLDRTVAIKILSPQLAEPEHRARFEREARTIAGLSHPHICTVHDVGQEGASYFLVMEHLAGETLADRIRKGPLPVDQALQTGAQIADALSAAHRAGIVHRDLKPANVMLTKSGVKLLDFGLARLRTPAVEPALSATMTQQPALTARGTIVGTLHYMAPEQLEGRESDPRTDIWALGLLLYEMVTGRRAFEGQSAASLIAAILEHEPPRFTEIAPSLPPSLDGIVSRCLAKNPDDRWESAHDIGLQLRTVATAIPPLSPRRSLTPRWAIAGTLALIAIGASGFAVARLTMPRREPPQGSVRFSVAADGLVPQRGSFTTVAVSADGSLIVFAADAKGVTTLFLRRIEEDSAHAIAGTEGATSPFLSPDARWVGFFREQKLMKVPIEGGPAQTIADAPTGRGGAWRSDGTIFFAPTHSGPILQVSADGGAVRQVTTLDATRGENSHRFPWLMPGGDVLLFTVRRSAGYDDAEVAAVRLATGERRTLVEGGVQGAYLPSGYLVFCRATTLMAVAFDGGALQRSGSPAAVAEGVDYRSMGGVCDFAVSNSGTLVYVPVSVEASELVRVSRNGSAVQTAAPRAYYRALSLSPDGHAAAVSTVSGERTELYVVDFDRGTRRPLTRGYRDETPFWADDRRLFFSSSRHPPSSLFWMAVDSTDAPREIQAAGAWRFIESVSHDGRTLLYGDVGSDTGWDLWAQPLDAGAPARKLFATSFQERYARLSPDGRTLVFTSDESGRSEVYAVTYPDLGHRVQVSTAGGSEPVWAHSGREVFYRADDAVVVVSIDTAASLTAGTPVTLFETPLIRGNALIRSYDVLPGDRGFVVIRAVSGRESAHVQVVQNWPEEVKAKVSSR